MKAASDVGLGGYDSAFIFKAEGCWYDDVIVLRLELEACCRSHFYRLDY